MATTQDTTLCCEQQMFSNLQTQDFVKSSELAPDCSMILSESELGSFILSSVHLQSTVQCDSSVTESTPILAPYTEFPAGESIYSCAWYPHMTIHDTASCCFIASARDHPIHLWDMAGYIRCSYIPKNHVDELDSSYCVAFNLAGDKFYAGANRKIR